MINITAGGKTSIGTLVDLGVVVGCNTQTATQYTNTAWSVFSSKKLKENIEDANNEICYNNIRDLKLKRFKWIDPFKENDSDLVDNHSVGFIAEDLEQFYPKSVSMGKYKGQDDMKTMNISAHQMSLFGAVQLMQTKIENLEMMINKLLSVLPTETINKFNSL